MDPDIHHLPFPYPWALEGRDPAEFFEEGIRELAGRGVDPAVDLCGVMLETFQGWGAVFYPTEYVRTVEAFCRDFGLSLAFDEMQAGFGRTGRDFGFHHYGVTPDLICCGKGMSGGLPLSGVLGRADLLDVADVGSMSSTHSANPLACAASLAVLDEMVARDLTAESARKGVILHEALTRVRDSHPERVSMVLGRGLVAAILMRDPSTGRPDGPFASRVAERCMHKGVLVVHTGRESIKIGPPLTIPDGALHELVEVLESAISEVEEEER
jgi:4-aminobutyrate aminotransferase-like enzyme